LKKLVVALYSSLYGTSGHDYRKYFFVYDVDLLILPLCNDAVTATCDRKLIISGEEIRIWGGDWGPDCDLPRTHI
jgi:hypothetical protein